MERELKRTEEKYLSILIELHNILKYTNRISMNDFCQSKNISKGMSQVMQNGGIIKCLKKGRQSEWVWQSIPPNIQMVRKIIKTLQEVNPPRKRKPQVKPVERPILAPRPNPVPPKTTTNLQQLRFDYDVTSKTERETVKISILWGLFTYIKK